MDSGALNHLNLGPIIWFALFGLVCAVAIALGLAGWLTWFFLTHAWVAA